MNKQERYAKFKEDLEEAGFDVEDYKGRNFFAGPAVRIDSTNELQEVIRATEINVQWDQLGLGLIVYPR